MKEQGCLLSEIKLSFFFLICKLFSKYEVLILLSASTVFGIQFVG